MCARFWEEPILSSGVYTQENYGWEVLQLLQQWEKCFISLKPLVGKSPNHIQSTSNFVNRAKGVILLLGECLTPYDVNVPFTSVPIDPALNIIKDLLERDESCRTEQYYQCRTSLNFWGSVCIILTSFKINSMSRLKEWLLTPVISIVANLYMEHFEREALWSASTPSRHWFRFVDDTFIIQQQAHKQAFLDHINSIDPAI